MVKADLHIHTVNTGKDHGFTFSQSTLEKYINECKLDCIAITNHNVFDENQYKEISDALSITVFPGIEINLEKGHILVIASNEEVGDFISKCEQVEGIIKNDTERLELSEFQKIFVDLNRYILIPHYQKNPQMNQEVLDALQGNITAGEVSSPKNFFRCIKDDDALVPVCFSDIRISDELTIFPTKQTYFDLTEVSYTGIKSCLMDKDKVSLSSDKGHDLFQILKNGLKISSGITVVLGERSSGKTYTLDEINKTTDDVKYIEQFSLLEKDKKKEEERFERKIASNRDNTASNYLKEFKDVVDDIITVDLGERKRKIGSYLLSLLENANDEERKDHFAETKLFNESKFVIEDLNTLKQLIGSVENIIENVEFKELVDKHIDRDALIALHKELITRYQHIEEVNAKKIWINDLIDRIQEKLRFRSSADPIEEVEFLSYVKEKTRIEKFEQVIDLVKREKVISQKYLQGYKIVAETKHYSGAAELKEKSGKRDVSFRKAFEVYDNPVKFLDELKEIELIEQEDYYKYFIKIEYKILNQYNIPVSGGERAEYNLLNAIEDALKYDILLLDEPESSFDNIFLKERVNGLIKEIAKHLPVVVVTHNNTVGASIKPDYLIYARRDIIGNEPIYKLFSGLPSDTELMSLSGEKMRNFDVLLNCLEAGETAYKERGHSYEILKN